MLDKTTEIGLVHMLLLHRGHAYHAICSCCSCCCHGMVGLLRFGHKIVEKSEYIATHAPENCTNCGLCVQYCNFKAWSAVGENQVVLDNERCFGCGVCVVHCPAEAITLKKRTPS